MRKPILPALSHDSWFIVIPEYINVVPTVPGFGGPTLIERPLGLETGQEVNGHAVNRISKSVSSAAVS